MDKNCAIEIFTAKNGYVVRSASLCQVARDEGTKVFQSHAELTKFIAEHFTFRSAEIKSDLKK